MFDFFPSSLLLLLLLFSWVIIAASVVVVVFVFGQKPAVDVVFLAKTLAITFVSFYSISFLLSLSMMITVACTPLSPHTQLSPSHLL